MLTPCCSLYLFRLFCRLADKQLATWKLRVESTPTQLDELLSDSTSKNLQLDQTIASLEEQLGMNEEKHQVELKGRDDAISSLESNLQDLKTLEAEIRGECDTLREDMTALSQAYSSLEEEYQRQAGQIPTATSAPTGEQEESSRQQPEGEVSQQTPTGSNEVSALRSENARLREDANAAADWMAMAVDRMNTIGGENISLQQQLASLQEQLQQTSTVVLSADEMQSRLAQERDLRSSVEAKVTKLTETGTSSQRLLENEQAHRQELEIELTQSKEAIHQLEGMRLRSETLDAEVASLRATIQSLSGSERDISAYREELQNLTMQLSIANAEVSSLKAELTVTLATGKNDDAIASETISLRATVESLQVQLSSMHAELSSTSKRQQEDIYTRETKIRELESRMSGEKTDFTVDGRDAEIAELQSANGAAQEWMTKALEHHQMLSAQIAAAMEEKASLGAQLKGLEADLAATGTVATRAEQLQEELDKQNVELQRLRKDLEDQSRSTTIEQDKWILTDREAEFEALRMDVRAKEESLNRLRYIEERTSHLEAELEQRDTDLDEMRVQLENRDDMIQQLQTRVSEGERLEEMVEEYVSELDTLRAELASKEGELESARSHGASTKSRREELEAIQLELAALQTDLTMLKERLAAKEEENLRLATRASAVDHLEQELQRLTLQSDSLQASCSSKDKEMLRLRENSSHKTKDSDDGLQTVMVEKEELLNDKEHLESELRDAQEDLNEDADVVREWGGAFCVQLV